MLILHVVSLSFCKIADNEQYNRITWFQCNLEKNMSEFSQHTLNETAVSSIQICACLGIKLQ